MSGTHVLYRVYDADGALLYIGITGNVENRLRQHSQTSLWWDEFDSWTAEKFTSREELERAERAAIEAEVPICNVRWNPSRPPRPAHPEVAELIQVTVCGDTA